MITRVLRLGTADIDSDYLKTITDTAREYVEGIFRRLREHGYDSKLMKLYVVGGGAVLSVTLPSITKTVLPSTMIFVLLPKAMSECLK